MDIHACGNIIMIHVHACSCHTVFVSMEFMNELCKMHSCQPVMTKKRDKILKKVGFSVKKRKCWIKTAKITQ